MSTVYKSLLPVKIYSRSEHSISRKQLNHNALDVLYELKRAGFSAYLVGGCVRDLLLGREPNDFDVATDAAPEQIQRLFRHCRLVGKRFRLAHVYFGREFIEVATFRADGDPNSTDYIHADGRLLRDNHYGNLEQDVWRRDFTINALYYNIRDFSIVDYTGGVEDLKAGQLRLIGDPMIRYREDPVRMLRVIRFAVKLGFNLHPDTEKPLSELAHLLLNIPPARLYDESLKLFLSGYSLQIFEKLRQYHLFEMLFPQTDHDLNREQAANARYFLTLALKNSDQRMAEGKSISPYFFLAVFLWPSLTQLAYQKMTTGESSMMAYLNAANELLTHQVKHIAIPKQFTQAMRDIWLLQLRLPHRNGIKPYRLLTHPRFRAAYDFLLLRSEAGEVEPKLAQWWTEFQCADEAKKKQMSKTTANRHQRTGNTKDKNKF